MIKQTTKAFSLKIFNFFCISILLLSTNLFADMIYDGDTAGYRLSDGTVINGSPGTMTETTGGNPGNLMRLTYTSISSWWQEHRWDKTVNIPFGANTHLRFNVRRAPTSPGTVSVFRVRIDYNGNYVDVANYLLEGGSIDSTWKTANIPLADIKGPSQTQIDFINFIANWNSDYTVDIDNISIEGAYTPTYTYTVNPLFTATYTPTPAPTSAGMPRISINGTEFRACGQRIWMCGANTPWDNWNDFGGNYDPDFWNTHYAQFNAYGLNSSRVWITCSGEVGINIDTAGYVSGATAAHWANLDDFFAKAQAKGVYIKATLISFDHFKSSYTTYQRWRNWINSDANIDSYINNYLIPFVNRYKNNTALWCIDMTNEPEWATTSEGGTITWDRFQKFWAKAAKAIHDNSEILVTVGIGVIKYNSDNPGMNGNKVSDAALQAQLNDPKAKLDFYSPHWYSWMDPYWTILMYTTPSSFGIGTKPCIVGEAPGTASTGHTLAQDYEAAYTNGWQGFMPWTSNGVDNFGNWSNVSPASNSFKNNHYNLVFPPCSTSTPTNTGTYTKTSTPVPPTATNTSTNTNTATFTFTATGTNTAVPTNTSTRTNTNTATYTYTATLTPVNTNTLTATNTAVPSTYTFTATNTATSTATHTAVNTSTNTSVPSATFTNTSINTPVNTATGTFTSTYTFTYTLTHTSTHTNTSTANYTYTVTYTPSETVTTGGPTLTFTHTFTQTYTSTSTYTAASTATSTYTNVPTDTATNIPATSTYTSTATAIIPTSTNTSVFTNTHTPVNTATFTHTGTNTYTNTPVPPTATSTASNTSTRTYTHTLTNTMTRTPTHTFTNTYTYTHTETAVPSFANTYTFTATITPTPTPSDSKEQEIKDILLYPNPYDAKNGNLKIKYTITKRAQTVKLLIYSSAFRLIREIEIGREMHAGTRIGEVKASQIKTLANGTYYFVITESEGKRSKADEIIILK